MRVKVAVDPLSSHNGFADVLLTGQSQGHQVFAHRLDVEYQPIWQACGPISEINSDLLVVAATIYALDKAVKRDEMPDRWTRSFSVDMPVHDPDRWGNAVSPLAACVRFLTGDQWEFRFTHRITSLPRSGGLGVGRLGALAGVEAIGLFSGGLDSLIGTIDWLESHTGKILLVGHHDRQVAGPLSDQRRLLSALTAEYPNRFRTLLARIGATPSGPEISFRSRSILFLGLALHASGSAPEGTPVLIPENGNIALNVPLTPSRQGSCSTRTAHPHYLSLLTETLRSLDIMTPLLNPLSESTKGECVLECLNQGFLRSVYPLSASCAKRGHTSSWIRKDAGQCGRCVPCLYRRAALHAAGWDDERYGVDVCAGEVPLPLGRSAPKGAEDALAMLSFLRHSPSATDVAASLMSNGRIPPNEAPAASKLVLRAMDEVRELFANKGNRDIRRAAGILRGGTTTRNSA